MHALDGHAVRRYTVETIDRVFLITGNLAANPLCQLLLHIWMAPATLGDGVRMSNSLVTVTVTTSGFADDAMSNFPQSSSISLEFAWP